MNISGHYDHKFESVAFHLSKQIKRFGGGGACSVYLEGEKVVDIWGGQARHDGSLWLEDTVALAYSSSKAVAVTLVHILADRGLIDYDQPVAKYWTEFGQNGKANITVRQALSHQAGLYPMRNLVKRTSDILDWEYMVEALEKTKPVHRPGKHNGYHAFTIGWLCGALIEKVSHQSFSEFLTNNLVDPLGLDGLFIGLPDHEYHRLADIMGLRPVHRGEIENKISYRQRRRVMPGPLRQLASAGKTPTKALSLFSSKKFYTGPIPAVNGTFTARSLAKMYAALANDGKLDGVQIMNPLTIDRAREIQTKRLDKVVIYPLHWRLGYHRADTLLKNYPNAFGHYGFGGAGGWANPEKRLAAAMVHNSYPLSIPGQTRMVLINGPIYKAARAV